jgi:hypothetical protein
LISATTAARASSVAPTVTFIERAIAAPTAAGSLIVASATKKISP